MYVGTFVGEDDHLVERGLDIIEARNVVPVHCQLPIQDLVVNALQIASIQQRMIKRNQFKTA